jgi:hypothetical protein
VLASNLEIREDPRRAVDAVALLVSVPDLLERFAVALPSCRLTPRTPAVVPAGTQLQSAAELADAVLVAMLIDETVRCLYG